MKLQPSSRNGAHMNHEQKWYRIPLRILGLAAAVVVFAAGVGLIGLSLAVPSPNEGGSSTALAGGAMFGMAITYGGIRLGTYTLDATAQPRRWR